MQSDWPLFTFLRASGVLPPPGPLQKSGFGAAAPLWKVTKSDAGELPDFLLRRPAPLPWRKVEDR